MASSRRLLLRDGRVLTPTGSASALLVDGEDIAWVGETAEATNLKSDRVVELHGRLVTPAFVDAHVHLAETGFAAHGVDLGDCTSATEALDRLGDHARSTELAVVLGNGWDESTWPDRTPLSRSDVDKAVGGRPAYISRVDLHSAVASTALLEVATGSTDGRLSESAGWSSDGPVARDAHHAVRDALRALLTPEDRASAIRIALLAAAAAGIGTVHEMGAPHINPAQDLETARHLREQARAAGAALPEVVGYWGDVDADLTRLRDVIGAAGDICVDGAVGSRTAAMEAPYSDAPSTRGHLYLDADAVAAHVVACTEAGLQSGFHVIGDRAVAAVVAGFQTAAERLGADAVRRAGHRLEHVEMVTPAQLEVLAALGVAASMQPVFQAWWGGPGGLYEQRLGERSRGMNAFGSMAKAGITLAFGSDSPVTPFDPWAAVRAATAHQEPRERLDARAAFDAHTAGGWRAAGDPTGGVVAPGAPASLAVWDPPGTSAADLDRVLRGEPSCVLTLVRGAVAHDRERTFS